MPIEIQKLTLAAGLAIQGQQLEQWRNLLKPGVFAIVQAEAVAHNTGLREGQHNGYDVWRGTDIDAFIHNMRNTHAEILAGISLGEIAQADYHELVDGLLTEVCELIRLGFRQEDAALFERKFAAMDAKLNLINERNPHQGEKYEILG